MNKLNPFAKRQTELQAKAEKERSAKRAAALKAKRDSKSKSKRSALYRGLQDGLVASFKEAEDLIAEEERQGNYVPGETSEEESDE